MSDARAVFAEKSRGYFVCENVESFASEELYNLRSIAIEFYGHRVTVSFVYQSGKGFDARTYYGEHVDSVKDFLLDVSDYIKSLDILSDVVDERLCCSLAESQIEIRYLH